MTSGGLSKAEAWNLQLQGRVKKLEEAMRQVRAMCKTNMHRTSCISQIDAVAREALRTNAVPREFLR